MGKRENGDMGPKEKGEFFPLFALARGLGRVLSTCSRSWRGLFDLRAILTFHREQHFTLKSATLN